MMLLSSIPLHLQNFTVLLRRGNYFGSVILYSKSVSWGAGIGGQMSVLCFHLIILEISYLLLQPSNADGRDDLLLFWMVGGELRYKINPDPS